MAARSVILDRMYRWTARSGEPITAIELLSLVGISALILLVAPYSYFSPAGSLDAWIPTTYFLNFEDTVYRFGYTYYAGRTPYFVFGIATYSAFSPLFANFVLNLIFFSIAVISLYAIAATSLTRILATAVVFAFALNTYTATAFAWDYPDGPAIAFALAGIAVRIAPSAIPAWRRFFYAGALFLMAGSTNLIAGLVVAPAAVWIWLSDSRRLRALAIHGVSLLAGIVVAFIVFSAISKVLIGTSRFIGLQLDQFRHAMRTPAYLSEMWGTGSNWVIEAPRLWTVLGLAIIGIAITVTYRSARRDPMLVGATLCYIVSAAAFLWVEFGMQAVVLRVSYHSSYLLAPAFVFLAALLGWLVRRQATSSTSHHLLIALWIIGLSFAIPAAYRSSSFPEVPVGLAWALVLAFTLAAAICWVVRNLVWTSAICLIGSTAIGATADFSMRYVFYDNEPTFEAVVRTSDVFRSGIGRRSFLRFWFDANEPLAPLFSSISTLDLWEWHDLTYGFGLDKNVIRQTPWAQHLPRGRRITSDDIELLFPAGTLIVHLTTNPNVVPSRQVALQISGVTTVWRGTWPIHARGLQFYVVVTEVTALDMRGRHPEIRL